MSLPSMPSVSFRLKVILIPLFVLALGLAVHNRTLADQFFWTEDNSVDTWDDPTNWSPVGLPNSFEDEAIFGGFTNSPQIVQILSPKTVNTIEFNNPNSFSVETIGGSNLFLDTPSATTNAKVKVITGNHSFLGSGEITSLKDVDFEIAGGSTLSLDQSATMLNNNLLTKTGNGDLRFNQSSTFASGTVLGQAGVISGTGFIPASFDNFGSIIEPGALNTDTLSVAGNFTQSGQGVLSIEFDGVLPGQQDQLVIQGNATLGGTLDLNFLSALNPAPGQVFDLVSAASFTPGSFFDQVSGVAVGPGGFSVFFDGTKMTISAVFCDTVGDMDCSGAVDEDDVELFAWALRDETTYLDRYWFGELEVSAAPAWMADMDGGGVTFSDLQPFVDAVNASAAAAVVSVSDVLAIINGPTVPEPSSLTLFLLLVGMVGGKSSFLRRR